MMSSSNSTRNIAIDEFVTNMNEDKLFVALGDQVKEGKSVLLWALQNSGEKKISLLHVHVPAPTISMISTMNLKAFREVEKQDMNTMLNEYLLICRKSGVSAEKLIIESDSIEKGIVELISGSGIKKLVMGAAASKHYSKKMAGLKSKKANYVNLKAPDTCHILFVCNRNLIYTREAKLDEFNIEGRLLPPQVSSLDTGINTADMVAKSEVDDKTNEKLEQAMEEAKNAKLEAFEESLRRGEAEKEVLIANSRAKAAENKYTEELNHREGMELLLMSIKQELEMMHDQRDEIIHELRYALGQKLIMEAQVAESNDLINSLEEKIISYVEVMTNYKNECDNALKLVEELKEKLTQPSVSVVSKFVSEFILSEIEEATHNFHPFLIIGESGYGSIYKGLLHHTEVAIKVLHTSQG